MNVRDKMKSEEFWNIRNDAKDLERELICSYLRKASEILADVTNQRLIEDVLEDIANKIERGEHYR